MSSGRSVGNTRVVFDTSALIGALLRPHSTPAAALELAALAAQIVVSADTLEELAQVLQRPHLDRYQRFEARMDFLARYRDLAVLHEVNATVNDCRDPKDNKFLSLAVSAQASIIVASDDDLRVLHLYRGIQILAPAQFIGAAQVLFKR